MAGVALAYLAWGSRALPWDVAERAYLLDHAELALEARETGGRTHHFLFFAHVLELPLAWVIKVAGGLPGLAALRLMSLLFGLGCLVLICRLSSGLSGDRTKGASPAPAAGAWAAALVAASLHFWVYATTGEERIYATFFLLLFFERLWLGDAGRRPWRRQAVLGGLLALAVLAHLWALALFPFLAASTLAGGTLGHERPTRWRSTLAVAAVAGGLVVAGLGMVAVVFSGVGSPGEALRWLTYYHGGHGIDFFHFSPSQILLQVRHAGAGLGYLVGGIKGLGLAVAAGVVLLAASGGRRREEGGGPPEAARLRTAARDFLAFTVVWASHFLFYEPANPESWLPVLTLASPLAAAALAGFARRPRRLLMAGALALVVVGNLPAYAARFRPPEIQRRAAALGAAVELPALVLTGGGFVRGAAGDRHLEGAMEIRQYKALAPEGIAFKSLHELVEPEYTDVVGRPRMSLDGLVRWRRRDPGLNLYFLGSVRREVEATGRFRFVHHRSLPGEELYRVTAVR